MTDRTALADALEGCTAETLREDVERIAGLMEDTGWDATTGTGRLLSRLAALALCVAEMQRRQEAECAACGYARAIRWTVAGDGDVEWFNVNVNEVPQTLPAALAQLLRGAP